MKRNEFDIEGKIVGQDFNQLIDKVGGKAAGLHLLRKTIDYLQSCGQLTHRGEIQIGHIPWHSIPTDYYSQFEKILRTHLKASDGEVWGLANRCDMEAPQEVLEIPGVKNIIDKVIEEVRQKFPEESKYSMQAFAPAGAVPFHLRSSTTSEDFRDDRYFGTFLTKEHAPFLFPERGANSLLEMMLSFYAQKFHSRGRYELDEKDSLAMILMPTLTDDRGKSTNIIAYSSYPEEKGSPAVIEVGAKWQYRNSPLQLMKLKGLSDIEIIPARVHALEEMADAHNIFGRKSAISQEATGLIYDMLKWFEEVFPYPSNIEAVIVDNYLVPLQLRPVPHLPEKREVEFLQHLPENAYLIAETPFVMGSFRKTARLVMPDYKNDYLDHKFKEPVIVWHTDEKKGHRFYFSDENCVGMLNPEMGAALSHDSSLLPTFGKFRDRFAFIGLPFPGIKEKLEGCMKSVKEKVGSKKGEFSYTLFPITIESDGRRGRIYVDEQYASYFK